MRGPWIAPAVFVLLLTPAASAEPRDEEEAVIERVVAVVGHEAIFGSELEARAAPYLKQIDAKLEKGAARDAARAQATRDVLNKLIDERLIALAADKEKIEVTREEIDRALASVASSQKLTVAELLRAAHDQGLPEAEYRAELRRQLLEGKLLARAVTRRAKGGPAPSGNAFNEAMQRERERILGALRGRTFIEKRL